MFLCAAQRNQYWCPFPCPNLMFVTYSEVILWEPWEGSSFIVPFTRYPAFNSFQVVDIDWYFISVKSSFKQKLYSSLFFFFLQYIFCVLHKERVVLALFAEELVYAFPKWQLFYRMILELQSYKKHKFRVCAVSECCTEKAVWLLPSKDDYLSLAFTKLQMWFGIF